MALIRCTECNNEVSDRADKCPHCGCPISEIKKDIAKKENRDYIEPFIVEEMPTDNIVRKKTNKQLKKEAKIRKTLIILTIIIVTIILVGGGWFYFIFKPAQVEYAKYTENIHTLNSYVDTYNENAKEYNEIAQTVNTEEIELDEYISKAQSILDYSVVTFDPESLEKLSTSMNKAEGEKINLPSNYELQSYETSSTYLKWVLPPMIKNKNAEIEQKIADIESENYTLASDLIKIKKIDFKDTMADLEKFIDLVNSSNAIQAQLTAPSEEWIVERLKRASWIANVACATEENDPNNLLGKDGGYITQAFFSTPYLKTEKVSGNKLIEMGTRAGGSIEVYKTVEEAEKRNEYLKNFDGTFVSSGKHRVVGTMIIRISDEFMASDQSFLMGDLIQIFTELE